MKNKWMLLAVRGVVLFRLFLRIFQPAVCSHRGQAGEVIPLRDDRGLLLMSRYQSRQHHHH